MDYEPQEDERSQSPQNPIDSMPEEGEVSDEPSTSKKSKKRYVVFFYVYFHSWKIKILQQIQFFFHPNFLNHKNDYNLVFFLSFRKKESISRSSSSASSASEKPKQYKDSDSDNSSSEDEVKIKPKKKKKSKKSHKEKESKRKVYVKEDNDRDDRDRDRGDRDREDQGAKPKSRDDSFFGVTYIPPAGFCEECDVR